MVASYQLPGVQILGKRSPVPARLARLQIAAPRWLTTHGFALSVTTDLPWSAELIPCSLNAVRMVSIESLVGLQPLGRDSPPGDLKYSRPGNHLDPGGMETHADLVVKVDADLLGHL